MDAAWSSARSGHLHALREVGVGMLAAGVPLLVYLRTMAPTVYGLDSAELTTGAYTLGIVHAPGSPTYMLLGHLFAQLPVGDVGYRLNLLSGFAALLAALFLYRILLRLTADHGIALGGSWFAAFTYYLWVSAVAAELYAVHAAFVAGMLLLALRWRDTARPGELCALALLAGLGAGNHPSMALLLPGFVWLVATGRARPWQPAWLPVAAVACLVLGAAVYLYLPLRYSSDAELNQARANWGVDLTTIEGFYWMVTGRMFRSFMFGVAPAELPRELATYAARLWSNFVGLGAVLGAAGLIGDWRRRRSLHIGLVLLVAGHLAFYLPYRVADKELMFLPTYLVWAVWVGLGAQVLGRWFHRHGWPLSPAALLLLLAAGTLMLNFQRVDLSEDWSARQRGEQILTSLEPGAVYLGTWSDATILEYLQIVERQRPDVRSMHLTFVAGHGAGIARQMLRGGHPVYASSPTVLGDDGTLHAEWMPECDCYRVSPAVWGAGASPSEEPPAALR